jgi:hypothetical protein
MKIIGLTLEGIRKIRAGEMKIAETGLTTIRGKNENGKSSVLDAILALFGGAAAEKEDLVTKGREKGRVGAVVIGENGEEYHVEKVLKAGGKSTLKVTDAKGISIPKQQSFLDSLISGVALNPRPFLSLGAAEKMKFLLDLFKVDTKAVDKEIKGEEEERTVLGREIKGIVVEDGIAEVARVNTAELLSAKAQGKTALEDAGKKRQAEILAMSKRSRDAEDQRNEFDRTYQNKTDRATAIDADIKKKEDEIRALHKERGAVSADIERMDSEREFLPEPIPAVAYQGDALEFPALVKALDDIDKQIAAISETNEAASRWAENEKRRVLKAAKEKDYADRTAKIKELRARRIAEVEKAVAVIPGLAAVIGGDDDRAPGLYMNGIHSDSWSHSQSLSIALDLARAANPTLRAVLLDDGESFDPDNLKTLENWSILHDMQAIVAIVAKTPDEDGTEFDYWISDGEISIPEKKK